MNNSWQTRWKNVVDRISITDGPGEEVLLLNRLEVLDKPTVVGFINAHAMNTIADDESFYDALIKADILLRDGSGMEQLYRMLNRRCGSNMNGTDLIPRLLKRYTGRQIAVWGTCDPYLSRASQSIEKNFRVNVVSRVDGFGPSEDYVALAQKHRPSLILLGMGMPKQEEIAAEIRKKVDYPVLIVCGGAIIDFLGGRFPRAPLYMRKMGLEWCYRLLREPKRLFTRYVIGNPKFLLHARTLATQARHS